VPILYVEPVYLQASSGGIPELKRVIVAFGDNLAMENTLGDALQKVFEGVSDAAGSDATGTGGTSGSTSSGTSGSSSGLTSDLITRANELYMLAQDALKDGDFSGYADYIEQLGVVLAEMRG